MGTRGSGRGGRGEEKAMVIPDSEGPPPSGLSAAIGVVRRGREVATQLVALLRADPGQRGGMDEAAGLAELTLASFSTALSALDPGRPSDPPRDSAAAGRKSPWPDPEKTKPRPAGGRRRGQTRRSQPYGCTTVASKTLDDGHTWRKYGQKDIHGAKYPRCYFRCTHKHDQGCQAARQVQRSEEDPSMFVITYLGNHTCKKPMGSHPPEVGHDAGDQRFLITFGQPDPWAGGGQDPRPPASFPQPKQESEDDALSSQLSRDDSASSPEYFMLPELMPLESSVPMSGISGAASDVAGDVTSGLLGVDFTGEPFQLEDMLGLEHDDFEFVYC